MDYFPSFPHFVTSLITSTLWLKFVHRQKSDRGHGGGKDRRVPPHVKKGREKVRELRPGRRWLGWRSEGLEELRITGAGNYQTAVVRDRGKRYRLGNQTLLLLLLVSHFSRVRLCATPETAAHQAPPSLGFSHQEHYLSVTHHMSFMSSLTSQVYSFPQV